ncbi:MAG: tripartite tricarboxylate transporter substrate binding protein [Planctomycetota bacterium]|nr:tripartite tricarboxylate transporter substrate binding protein [Planctomycetota bacterium]
MKPILGHLLACGAIVALMVACLGSDSGNDGDSYPARPIKLVVPFGPGGGSDTFGRIIKRGIDEAGLLPQPFVIINRPGGSATIGSRYVRDAKPDGYTLLLLHDAIITARYSGKVNYGPEAFEPVASTGQIGMVVAVKDSSRFQTLSQLLDECRAKPDTITNGVNLGAPTHFAALQLEQAFPGAKFRFTQSGDGADRSLKLVGDHIAVSEFSVSEFVGFEAQGLRALAYLGEDRCEALPDVPTAREQGVDVVDANRHYWWFPKGTPPECVDYVANVLKQAMQTEHVRKSLAELQMEPSFLQGQEFANYIDEQVAAAQKVGQQQPPQVPDIPQGVGWALVACVAVMFIESRRATVSHTPAAIEDLASPATLRTVGLLAATAGYVLAMQYGVPFAWATVAFILCGGLLLSTQKRRHALLIAESSLIVAFGVQFVLTKIVVTDLP